MEAKIVTFFSKDAEDFIFPNPGFEFWYQQGWQFLEERRKATGEVVRFINISEIAEMETDLMKPPPPPERKMNRQANVFGELFYISKCSRNAFNVTLLKYRNSPPPFNVFLENTP